jgi:uncharacterized protein YjbI with pentapeptide repeats
MGLQISRQASPAARACGSSRLACSLDVRQKGMQYKNAVLNTSANNMTPSYLQEFVAKLNNEEDFRKEVSDTIKYGLLPESVNRVCTIISDYFMEPIPDTDLRSEEEKLIQERLALIENELFADQQAYDSLCKIIIDSCETPKELIECGEEEWKFIESQVYGFFIRLNKDSLLKDNVNSSLRNWLYKNQRTATTDSSLFQAVVNEAAKLGYNFTLSQVRSSVLHSENCKNLVYREPLNTSWYLPILQSGSKCWNKWRNVNADTFVNFSRRIGPGYRDNGILDLSNANMSSLRLVSCSFVQINFQHANFSGSRVMGSEFIDCDLTSVTGLDRDTCTIDSSCKI